MRAGLFFVWCLLRVVPGHVLKQNALGYQQTTARSMGAAQREEEEEEVASLSPAVHGEMTVAATRKRQRSLVRGAGPCALQDFALASKSRPFALQR